MIVTGLSLAVARAPAASPGATAHSAGRCSPPHNLYIGSLTTRRVTCRYARHFIKVFKRKGNACYTVGECTVVGYDCTEYDIYSRGVKISEGFDCWNGRRYIGFTNMP